MIDFLQFNIDNINLKSMHNTILNRNSLHFVDFLMAKQVYECNWAPSRVTETQLNNLVLTGALSSKNTIHWRVPGKECPPTPQEGEVVVFADHLAQGFNLPGSKFYRDVLANFQLHPQDTGPVLLPTYAISKCSVRC